MIDQKNYRKITNNFILAIQQVLDGCPEENKEQFLNIIQKSVERSSDSRIHNNSKILSFVAKQIVNFENEQMIKRDIEIYKNL